MKLKKLRNMRKFTPPIIKHGTTHITPADGNVFLDIGFPPEEAAELLEKAKKMVQGIWPRQAKKAERKRKPPTSKKLRNSVGENYEL